MATKHWMAGTAGIAALAVMTAAAQSAPLASTITDFRSTTATTSNVEKAQYRICAMERGVRRCRMASISGPYRSTGRRMYGYRATGPVYGYQAAGPVYGYQATGPVYGYQGISRQYGYQFPDQYPVGSGAWWRSMELLGRAGTGGRD